MPRILQVPQNIPVLEDKYAVSENLEELGAAENQSVTSEESQVTALSQQQSSITMGSSLSQTSQTSMRSMKSDGSIRTMQDSSYSTSSFVSGQGGARFQDGEQAQAQVYWITFANHLCIRIFNCTCIKSEVEHDVPCLMPRSASLLVPLLLSLRSSC